MRIKFLSRGSFVSENWPYLLLIIGIGILVRAWGITYGLPSAYNSTEYFIAKHALSFGARKTLEPLFFVYPTFYTYLIAAVYGLYFLVGYLSGQFSNSTDFALKFLLDPGSFYLIGRSVNAVFLIIATVIFYRTARFWSSKSWSILIAFTLLFSYTIDQFAFWMIPDGLLILGTTIVLYFMVKSQDAGISRREMIFASLVCGLTISAKYNAGFLAAGWILNILLDGKREMPSRIKRAAGAIGLILLGFFMGTPYGLIAFGKFLTGFQMISSQARYAYNFEAGLPYGWELKQLLFTEWVLGLLLMLTLILPFFWWRKKLAPFMVIVWPTFLYVGSWQKKGLDYMLVIFPVLFLTLLYWAGQFQSRQKYVSVFKWIIALSLFINIPRIMYQHYRYTQTDTRQMATDWIKAHLPPGSAICYDHYHYDLTLIDLDRYLSYGAGSRFLDTSTRQRLEELKKSPISYQFISAQNVLEITQIPDTIRQQVEGDSFLVQNYLHPHKTLKEIRDEGARILVLNSDSYLKYMNNPIPAADNPLREDFISRGGFYETVFSNLSPIQIFKPSWKNPGPVIQIFNLEGLNHESDGGDQRLQL